MTVVVILFLLSISWHLADFTTEQIEKHGSLKIPDSVEITTEINNNQIDFFHYTTTSTPKQTFDNKIQARILKNQVEIFENEMAPDIIDDLSKRLVQQSSTPIAFVIDDTPKTYYDAMSYIDKLYDNLKSEFWLMKFNASGVSNVLTKSKVNFHNFKIQFESNKILNGGAVFFAILKASQLLPDNSAIIVFTSKNPIDEDISHLTAYSLAQKNTKIYVIWTGTSSSEIELLKETTLYSGGKFYYQNIEKSEETDMALREESPTRELIIIKNNNIQNELFRIPIDRSIKNLEVMIDGSIKSATLISPNGYFADLLNITSLRVLSPGSHVTHAHECCHTAIRFNTAKVMSTPVIGLWKLRVITQPNGNNKNGFNITIFAETDLTVSSDDAHNSPETFANATNSSKEKQVYLKVKGDITKIENISFLDQFGHEIQNVPLNIVKQMKIQDGSKFHNTESDKTFDTQINISKNVPKNAYYIKINGTNNNDEAFSRLSYVNRDIQSTKLPPITIETSTRSELIASTLNSRKIVFEVTNNRDQVIGLAFSARDQRGYLQSVWPGSSWVAPRQTIEVTISTTQLRATTSSTDLITLIAGSQGDKAEKSAILYITNDRVTDNTRPYLNYKFTSNCMEISYSSCQSGTWTIEVTAQDSESGLLKIESNPPGLYTPNGYISGTKESVTGYYSASCCQPYLEITAIDLNNNRRSYKTDAYKSILSTGSIVAIVLGVILLIILIIIIAFLIRRCIKKRQSSDLPRFRGGQTESSRF